MDRARAALATLALAAAAGAHEEEAPKQDELVIERDRITVLVVYDVPRGDVARALRGLFDTDRSGGLDDAERARLARHLGREATAFLRLTVDERVVELAVAAPAIDDRGGGDAGIALRVALAAALPLAPGRHALRLEDHHKDRRIVTPVRLSLAPGVSLAAPQPPRPLVDQARPLVLPIVVSSR